MTTATETMKQELYRIEAAREQMQDGFGFPIKGYAQRDFLLAKKAAALREAIDWMSKTVLMILMLTVCVPAMAYDAQSFCDAVYHAEGGAKAKKPYGVLSVPCNGEAECRRICINSYNNNQKRFANQSKFTDFTEFFASRWAPIGVANDPTNLNANWLKNVRWFLANPKAVQ